MSKFILNEDTDFDDIIGVLLSNWKTLRLTIGRYMRGSYEVMQCKIKDLILSIHDCLKNNKNDFFTVCDIIEDVMDVGFNVEVESCDTECIGREICRLYIDWIDTPHKRKTVLDELKNIPITIPIHKIASENIHEQLMIGDLLVSSNSSDQ